MFHASTQSKVSVTQLGELLHVQFLGVSIWTYKDRSVAQIVTQVVSHPAEEAASWGAVWLPILMMYSPVQIVCTVFSLSFMLAPPSFAAAFWVGFMALYYAITLPGAPEHTGGGPSIRYCSTQTLSSLFPEPTTYHTML